MMVSFPCVCCRIKEAEGDQSGSQQAGGGQQDSETMALLAEYFVGDS